MLDANLGLLLYEEVSVMYNKNIMRQSTCLVFNPITVNNFVSLFNCTPGVRGQTQWWPRHKAIYFSWLGSELFCLLLGPPGFNCWFSFAPVFQWCCSTPQGSPGVGRNSLFLSSPDLCFIIVFICDLFVSRDDPLMSKKNLHADRTTVCFEPSQKPSVRLGSRKTGLSPPPPQYFNTDRSKAVLLLWFLTVSCSCCPYLYFGSVLC